MVTEFPIQGILDHLVKRIVDIMPVTGAGVTLISPGLDPRYIAASNASALRFEQLQTELGEGPCLAAYYSGEAIAVPDLRSEERFPRFSPRALEAGLAAVFTFPLHHGKHQQGALDLYRDTPGPLSPESMVTAQTLADVAAAYLLNAQARDDLLDSSEQFRQAALHDPLTELPNRVLMLERLEHAFLRGRRSGKTSAVFFIDLDHFKAVNDTHGHQVGDQLLIAVAERLTGVLRPGDTLARFSGDEFVILCEDLDHPSQADLIADRVDTALALPFVLSDTELSITASLGVAFTGRDDDAAKLLHDSDLAMYRTKRQKLKGRQALDPRELHLAADQDDLEDALPGAAERAELQLAYQPIVAADDGRVTGIEALLRWMHASRGLVSPTVLIPLAEKSGQIIEIGQWVLEQAWSDRHRWQIDLADELAVSVNVSTHQLMSAGFIDSVAAMLNATSAEPRLLTLDVTENAFVRDRARAIVVLSNLKEIGVRLALDDFGTGYSSLNYLTRYPLDTIKINSAVIATLGSDPASRTLVTAVIQLAHELGMTVLSEGVETAEQHDELSRLGCDSYQGFYFAQPMFATPLDSLLQRSDRSAPCLP
jgi:diguanylate cyclase (GGDEF)-like protein